MKAEQQMTIRKYLGRCEFDDDEFFAAVDAFDADLRAMQTPITAGALLADGWNNDRDNRWSYRVDLLEWIIIEIVGDEARLIGAVDCYTLPGCKTMYDLRELVRLLGGVK